MPNWARLIQFSSTFASAVVVIVFAIVAPCQRYIFLNLFDSIAGCHSLREEIRFLARGE